MPDEHAFLQTAHIIIRHNPATAEECKFYRDALKAGLLSRYDVIHRIMRQVNAMPTEMGLGVRVRLMVVRMERRAAALRRAVENALTSLRSAPRRRKPED